MPDKFDNESTTLCLKALSNLVLVEPELRKLGDGSPLVGSAVVGVIILYF